MINDTQYTVLVNINSNNISDYYEQIKRMKNQEQMMWEDIKGNPTKKQGGLLCFVMNNKTVNICQITKIFNPCYILYSWSKNVGKSERNVLYLSPIIKEINWKEWLQIGGHKRVIGSNRLVSNHKQFIEGLKEILLEKLDLGNNSEIRHKIIGINKKNPKYLNGYYNSETNKIKTLGVEKELSFIEFADFHYQNLIKFYPEFIDTKYSYKDLESLHIRDTTEGICEMWFEIELK